MSKEDEMNCDVCAKDCEHTYGKGPYNGNKNVDMMCLKCFEEVFDERFFESERCEA